MQLTNLSNDDLSLTPIWHCEGALDQDATVTPVGEFQYPNSEAYIARTRFTLADGSILWGYCSPTDASGLDYIQPVIILRGVHLPLWLDEPPHRPVLDRLAEALGRPADGVTPIEFYCAVPFNDENLRGEIRW